MDIDSAVNFMKGPAQVLSLLGPSFIIFKISQLYEIISDIPDSSGVQRFSGKTISKISSKVSPSFE